MKLGDKPRAFASFREVLKLDPDNFQAQQYLDEFKGVELPPEDPTAGQKALDFLLLHPVASLFMFSGACFVLGFLFGLDSGIAPLFFIGWLLSAVLAIIMWWNTRLIR